MWDFGTSYSHLLTPLGLRFQHALRQFFMHSCPLLSKELHELFEHSCPLVLRSCSGPAQVLRPPLHTLAIACANGSVAVVSMTLLHDPDPTHNPDRRINPQYPKLLSTLRVPNPTSI